MDDDEDLESEQMSPLGDHTAKDTFVGVPPASQANEAFGTDCTPISDVTPIAAAAEVASPATASPGNSRYEGSPVSFGVPADEGEDVTTLQPDSPRSAQWMPTTSQSQLSGSETGVSYCTDEKGVAVPMPGALWEVVHWARHSGA